MTPTERRRPVTRRRRLAHLGIGGVVIAAASVHAITADPPKAVPAAEAAPVPLVVLDPDARQARADAALRASRSAHRRALAAAARAAAARAAAPPAAVSPPTVTRVPAGESVAGIPPVWVALIGCEAGGDWHINTGNGYSGGPQFASSTWLAEGGGAFAPQAWEATPLEQLVVARRVLAAQGVGAWPVCGPRVGLARGD